MGDDECLHIYTPLAFLQDDGITHTCKLCSKRVKKRYKNPCEHKYFAKMRDTRNYECTKCEKLLDPETYNKKYRFKRIRS